MDPLAPFFDRAFMAHADAFSNFAGSHVVRFDERDQALKSVAPETEVADRRRGVSVMSIGQEYQDRLESQFTPNPKDRAAACKYLTVPPFALTLLFQQFIIENVGP